MLGELGYTNVAHLEPGFNGWKAAGGAVVDAQEKELWIRRDRPVEADAPPDQGQDG